MRRSFAQILLALIASVFFASNACAQMNIRPSQPPVGVGVGVGVGVPYGYPYGAYGFFPGAYGSSWSNGFSLYGPPVPTYGSVPGAFGGADQRLNNFSNLQIYNGALIGLGRSGAGGAGPRRRHYAGDGLGGAAVGGLPTPVQGQATIEVRVPVAAAEVFFEGTNTRQQGLRRVFKSPSLEGGVTYHYKITARWRDGERVVEKDKTAGVRAGESTIVDFTKDEPGQTPPLIGVGPGEE